MRKTRLLRGLRLVVLCGIQLRGFCCCFKTSCGTPGWLWAHSVLISFPALGSCCCEWTPTKVKARQGSIAASILYGWLLLAAWQGQGWLSGFGLWQSDQKVGAILGLFLYEGEDLPESQSNFHFCSVVQSYWHCQLIVLCSFFGEKLDHNCFFPKGTLDFFFLRIKCNDLKIPYWWLLSFLSWNQRWGSFLFANWDLIFINKVKPSGIGWHGGEGQTAFWLRLLLGICVTSLFFPHHEKSAGFDDGMARERTPRKTRTPSSGGCACLDWPGCHRKPPFLGCFYPDFRNWVHT